MNIASVRPTAPEYLLEVYSQDSRLDFYKITEQFHQELFMRHGKDALQIFLQKPESYIFVFRYGSIVFLNVPGAQHFNLLQRIRRCMSATSGTFERDSLCEDDFRLRIDPLNLGVSFNGVNIPAWNDQMVAMICNVLAHSSSLELLERQVERGLQDSEQTTSRLMRTNFSLFHRSRLLMKLLALLETRHRIVNQLTLLREPEIAWQDEFAARIYKDLTANFDLQLRVATLEKHLSLMAEVAELQLDVFNTKKSERLEIIIIVLIAVEILQSMLYG